MGQLTVWPLVPILYFGPMVPMDLYSTLYFPSTPIDFSAEKVNDDITGREVMKLFFMLNSAELEI